MTIYEAITHAEEVMMENLEKTKDRNASDPTAIKCFECADEHRQLAEWMKDYKRLLGAIEDIKAIMVAILGIVHTAVGFLIWFGALTYMDASEASIICYLEPLIAIVLSVVLLHEDLGLMGWLGAAVILGSTFMPEMINHHKLKKMEAAENS